MPGPLLGYAGNPNNNNGWIEADGPLLRELEVVADKPMVGPRVNEIAEPIIEMEEQMIAPMIDVKEDIAMLFGDIDFSHDDSEKVEEEEIWEVNEEWLMAPITPPLVPAVQPPSVYEGGGPSTAAAEGPSFPLPTPGLHVIQVSDAEVAASESIGEIAPRVFAIKGQVQVIASQMVRATDRFEQIGTQLPAKSVPTESIQQSPHLFGSQFADPALPGCQSAQICPQHEPSETLSPTHVP
nr:hypothetical protein [Tanacetum cinerariifolium]